MFSKVKQASLEGMDFVVLERRYAALVLSSETKDKRIAELLVNNTELVEERRKLKAILKNLGVGDDGRVFTDAWIAATRYGGGTVTGRIIAKDEPICHLGTLAEHPFHQRQPIKLNPVNEARDADDNVIVVGIDLAKPNADRSVATKVNQ